MITVAFCKDIAIKYHKSHVVLLTIDKTTCETNCVTYSDTVENIKKQIDDNKIIFSPDKITNNLHTLNLETSKWEPLIKFLLLIATSDKLNSKEIINGTMQFKTTAMDILRDI